MGKKGYGSAFGEAQRTCYVYISNLEKEFKRKMSVLVVDCLDGLHVLPFARKGHYVDCYETNNILINGGKIDDFNIIGLNKRIHEISNIDLVKINESNFYENKIDKKYDFVYVYRSLHLARNKDIPMDKKIRRLLSSVNKDGYIYIFYHLAEKSDDYKNYPRNSYFRKSQISKYFNSSWKIIDNHEREIDTIHKGHPFNKNKHYHKVGYLFAKKIKKDIDYNYHYKIVGCFNYDI